VITFPLVQINNSNQILKKNSKISHFCLLPLSKPPSLKISGCAPGHTWVKKQSLEQKRNPTIQVPLKEPGLVRIARWVPKDKDNGFHGALKLLRSYSARTELIFLFH